MKKVLLSLGSNLGDRAALLDAAAARLSNENQIGGFTESRRFETAPIGGPVGQNVFLNSVARCETTLLPAEFLDVLQTIENDLGRRRQERWGARVVDLDLLLYDNWTWQTTTLHVPHPRMALRRFVLEPAAEVAPDMLHPSIGWTIAKLWDHLRTSPNVLVLTAADLAPCEEIIRNVREQLQNTPAMDTEFDARPRKTLGAPKLVVNLLSVHERSSPRHAGPLLNLPINDLPLVIQEIAAAALAMRGA